MKRKKELYDDMKAVQQELKELSSIVKNDDDIPSQDEIHGWAIRMNICINKLKEINQAVLEFYTS